MAIVFSLCAAYVAYCVATNPAGPFTTPDSVHYLNASPIVPLGYPFFLKIFGARGAIIAQPIIFGSALAYLGAGIARLTRNTWLAVAIIIGTIALPQIREFHASILSESVFLSLLTVLLGLAVRFAHHPTCRLMVLVATAAGLSATVRRTGVAFVPVMLMMVLFERHRLKGSQLPLFFAAALAPFFIIIGVEQLAAPLVHAGHSSSLLGRHMFAKAALIDAPEGSVSGDPLRAQLDRHLQVDYAPIRQFLASAPADIRGVLSIYYETCLQGGCADRSRELMPGIDEAAQTATLGAAGMDRIRRAPIAFLALMARNYQSLWTVDRLRHPGRAARLTEFISMHRPMPFERLAFSLEPDQVLAFQASPRVRYAQWAVTALALWTAALALLAMIAIIRPARFSPLLITAVTAALAAHGGLLLTALLAAGFSRFTIGLWPAIVTAAAAGAWGTAKKLGVGSSE
jgi:hypothetical protein